MAKYEIVTKTKPRISQYPWRHVWMPRLSESPDRSDFDTYYKWWEESEWWINLSVHVSDKPEADRLVQELADIGLDSARSHRIIARLRRLGSRERSRCEQWASVAWQLPGDCGAGRYKPIVDDCLSSRYYGQVLEAMSAWYTHFAPSPDREVVATDYCRDALERYRYPERTRILLDLNKVQAGDLIPHCDTASFDVISVCFGYHYLTSPARTCRWFRQLLRSGGKIVFVENPLSRYTHLSVRSFTPKLCVATLKRAGFSQILVEELATIEDFPGNACYLIEATAQPAS